MRVEYKVSLSAFLVVVCACNKIVKIDPPVNTIVSKQAFSNDHNANSAVVGVYSKLIDQSSALRFGNSCLTIVNAISSDEMTWIGGTPDFDQVYQNKILIDNGLMISNMWDPAYAIIYQANACLEQLQGNANVTPSIRNQLIGEAEFIRAFVYFYLINDFGDVPYLTSTDYKANAVAKRTGVAQIYDTLKLELSDAIGKLPTDFSPYNGERIRATKWAAMALLARVCLYTGDWDDALNYSEQVIGSALFSLNTDLNTVFLKNSNEAIFQLAIDGTITPFNVLPESAYTLPPDHNSYVYFYFPVSFMSEWDSADLRKSAWIDTTNVSGTKYYYPSKYKVGPAQSIPNSLPAEYYMVLRLAEQFLIRAEAKAQKGDLAGGSDDLNKVRGRAGLGPETLLSKDDAISKILAERKKELFYEWGNRWFDLKRTGKIDSIMGIVAPQKGGQWTSTAQLFPIPGNEVYRDPNLTQNFGY